MILYPQHTVRNGNAGDAPAAKSGSAAPIDVGVAAARGGSPQVYMGRRQTERQPSGGWSNSF